MERAGARAPTEHDDGEGDEQPQRAREGARRVARCTEHDRADGTDRVAEPEHHPDERPDAGDVVLDVEGERHHECEHRPAREADRERPGVGTPGQEHEAGGADEERRRHRQEPRPAAADAVGEPGDEERGRDRDEVEDGDERPCSLHAPSSLDVRIGEPGVDAVVRGRHQREQRDEEPCPTATPGQPRRARQRPLMGGLVAREPEPRGRGHRWRARRRSSDARQPPSHPASGTASAAELAEPTWIPVV